MRVKKSDGFSLIELLVVVAIIGILAAVGITGYQVYISQTRDATTRDNFEFLKRTLDQDILSLENDLNARSDFATGLTSTSRCFELRDNYIEDINAIRNNPFNANKGQVCDGNHFTSYENEQNGGTAVDTTTLQRGQTMVYCDGVDVQTANWKAVNNNLGLKFCTCTGQETCETSTRYSGVVKDNEVATGSFVSVAIQNPTKTSITTGAQLLIGNSVMQIDESTMVLSGAEHTIEILLTSDVTSGTAIYETNQNQCFTPPGETSISNYLNDFSTLDVSNALPTRHSCY